MPSAKYAAFEPAAAYFDLVRGALGALVDGDHFFDVVADSVVYEVLYDFPGWPRVIAGRNDLMAAFTGYVANIALQSADKLIVHRTDGSGQRAIARSRADALLPEAAGPITSTVVIEYEVHGTILATRAKYDNRFCSIVSIENRKIAHWRDYMDSLAAWNALTSAR
jgi:ketosteroid isomerase-like protein